MPSPDEGVAPVSTNFGIDSPSPRLALKELRGSKAAFNEAGR